MSAHHTLQCGPTAVVKFATPSGRGELGDHSKANHGDRWILFSERVSRCGWGIIKKHSKCTLVVCSTSAKSRRPVLCASALVDMRFFIFSERLVQRAESVAE